MVSIRLLAKKVDKVDKMGTIYYSHTRSEIFATIPPNIKTTLNVGCATGAFSKELKTRRNTETWGIEMLEEYAHIAKDNIDHILIGTFDEVYDKLPPQYFDCVFFNDVLEHMIEPEDCLKKIKDKLTKVQLWHRYPM